MSGGAPKRDHVARDADAALRDEIIKAIRTVKDPELPVNLYDLGLVYDLGIADGAVRIRMTLTTPNCPVAESMPAEVRRAVEGVEGVRSAEVELVWEPPWTSERMSEDARMTLEMMGITWRDHRPGAGFTPITFGKKP